MAFIIERAMCAALFVGAAQLKPGKRQGILALLPSLGLIAGAVGFLLRPEIDVHIYVAYTLIGLSAAFCVWLVFKIVTLRKDISITARFTRLKTTSYRHLYESLSRHLNRERLLLCN